jgi:tellurite resistance protein TerC
VHSIASPLTWFLVVAGVVALLAVDLLVVHRKSREVTLRVSTIASGAWIALAVLFGIGVALFFGRQAGLEFAAGYLIEKALAVDNLFVFAVIFSAFGIDKSRQHRVLFWGVLGALVLRAIFVFAGGALLSRFHFIAPCLGVFLVFTGVKLLRPSHSHGAGAEGRIIGWVRRAFRVVPESTGTRFFLRVDGAWRATPLFLALVAVEISDVVFAVDSIPAVFAVTDDPFIVLTSNVLAVLGLRSLYALLAVVIDRFQYLHFGLAAVLVFIGSKMALASLVTVPIVVSLLVVALLLAGAMVASWWLAPKASPARAL